MVLLNRGDGVTFHEKGDGAYVANSEALATLGASACCIQQAFTVPLARCNHPFRMVGQQHPRSDGVPARRRRSHP